MKKRFASHLAAITIAVVGFVGVSPAQSVWTGGAGFWSSTGAPGWNGTGVPNAIGATADVSSATGNINADAAYTLGTLLATNQATLIQILYTGAGKLIFDVSAGSALIDVSGATQDFKLGIPVQLNDNLNIVFNNNSGGTRYFEIFRGISGTGQITFNNTGANLVGINIPVYSPGTQPVNFSGGLVIGTNISLRPAYTNCLGAGTVDQTLATQPINFINNNSAHDNNFILQKINGGNTDNLRISNPITVTLNGVLSSATSGFASRVSFPAAGTLVLAGNNTWTGDLFMNIDNFDATIQVNHLNALPDTVNMRTSNSKKASLLFNVAGTFTERIWAVGDYSMNPASFTMVVGTAAGFTGTTVLDSTSDLDFKRAIGGLELSVASADATLEIKSKLTDGGAANMIRNLVKSGAGTAIVSRATGNYYGGTTAINAGTLVVNGVLGGTDAVTVAVGATLGGTGTVSGATTVNGDLRPGNSPGGLTFLQGLTLSGTSTNYFEINGTSNSDHDYVNVYGAMTYGGVLVLNFGYTPTVNDAFDLFSANSYSGSFSEIQLTGDYAGDYTFDSGTGLLTVIPEPGTLSVLGFGLTAVLLRRRMRMS